MNRYKLVLAVGFALLMGACTGANRPAVGSPEWLWLAARDSYLAGDLDKASDHLERIAKQGNNPYVERARVWRAVIMAGLGTGHLELAQAYSEGWLKTKKNLYFTQKADHLKEAKRYGIGLLECYDGCVKQPPEKVVLEFPFPKGSAAEVTELDRIYKGTDMPDALRATAHEKTLDRGVVRAVGAVLTSPDNSAGAQKALQPGRAEVPTARMLLAMGTTMEKLSTVFDRKNLNEPDKGKIFHERAQDAAKRVLASSRKLPSRRRPRNCRPTSKKL